MGILSDRVIGIALKADPVDYECKDPAKCPHKEEVAGACAGCEYEIFIYPSYTTHDGEARVGIELFEALCPNVSFAFSVFRTKKDGVTVTFNLLIDDFRVEHIVKTGNVHDHLIAAAFADAVVEKLCQYPGSPVRAGVCDGSRKGCETCKDCIVRIKPALKELLNDHTELRGHAGREQGPA